jgi:hypothetical protein
VISQDSELLRRKPTSRGVRLGVDFVLRQRSTPYVSGKLFLVYIKRIFLPYLNKLRESEEFASCGAVLLLDNCSPHVCNAFMAVLIRKRVRVITFALHTTHIFQMLNVVLFGALEKHATGLRRLDEDQPAAVFIIKVYQDFKQMTVEINISGAFSSIEPTHS